MADHFLVIHLPGNLEPLERGEKYEDPLDEALHKAGKLGECVGGGTAMVTKPRFRITGCDIEVEVRSLDKALPVIQRVLEDSGAPVGAMVKEPETETTLLRFTRSGVKATKSAPNDKRKRFVDSCPWDINEVVAYRVAPRKMVLLHVVNNQMSHPWFRILDWVGSELPPPERIKGLVVERPRRWRLVGIHEVRQLKQGDRDANRLVATNIKICRTIRTKALEVSCSTWPDFDRMLKEVFSIGRVVPRTRLNHDLGLLNDILAFWDCPTPTTSAEARRLFYAYLQKMWYRNHPDYRPFSETENLRNFIRDLKAAFPEGEGAPWEQDFSAKERFVLVSLNDGQRKKVWKEACRLARRHRITGYDPHTDCIALS
jgi:hypothetical protein